MRQRLCVILLLFLFSFSPAAWGGDEIEASLALWRMLNDARAYPLETIRTLGIDEAQARSALGDDAWVLDEGLPPLAWNTKLYESARAHNIDMIERRYYAYNSPDGSTPAQRIAATGYLLLRSGELLGGVAFSGYIAPTEAAGIIFENLVRDELMAGEGKEPVLFSRYLAEAGVSVRSAVADLDGTGPQNIYVAVADLAEPAVYRVFLVGAVVDESGIGVQGRQVRLRSAQSVGSVGEQVTVSFVGGFFQFTLPPGFLMLEVSDEAGSILARRFLFGGRENQMIEVCVPWE